jgi:hypothetical protein
MNKPSLTAAQIAGDRPLKLGDLAIVTHTREAGGVPLTGKYRVLRNPDGLFVKCPRCGAPVRALYETARGLVCVGCYSIARKALEG